MADLKPMNSHRLNEARAKGYSATRIVNIQIGTSAVDENSVRLDH